MHRKCTIKGNATFCTYLVYLDSNLDMRYSIGTAFMYGQNAIDELKQADPLGTDRS
jgi:hypothetical protein